MSVHRAKEGRKTSSKETDLLTADLEWKMLKCASGWKSDRENVEDGN